MRRFFINTQFIDNSTPLKSIPTATKITLPDDVYHHWCRVLRAKVGQQSVLFDGLGGESLVELIAIDKKQATVTIISHNNIDRTAPYYSTVAIVMSRGDKMDYAIQKSTELGATFIQLLTSQHGEVRLKPQQVAKKLAHWQQIALSACEQCGLNRPPIVLSPLAIESWIDGQVGQPKTDINSLTQDAFYQDYTRCPPLKLVLAVPNPMDNDRINAAHSISDHISRHNKKHRETDIKPRFDILIGAEGGLTDEEYQLARQHHFIPWQLGNRTLRTETAPVVALSVLNATT